MSSEELQQILMISDDEVSIDSEEELLFDKKTHRNGVANGSINGALNLNKMEDSNLWQNLFFLVFIGLGMFSHLSNFNSTLIVDSASMLE